MSSLLTHDEYLALAGSIPLPTGAFIDGRAQAACSGETFETLNPANKSVLTHISSCGEADVDLAVSKAREAFDDGRWSRIHPSERKKIIIKLCNLIRQNIHELAVLESLESGKPIHDIETVDIPETLRCLEWHAEIADKIYDQLAPVGDDAVAMVIREPVGVVGCVLPWNFPMLMLAWKLGPALASGNSVIAKPAEETSMTALRIAELAHRAGVPRGVFNVITGLGDTAGKAIGLHPDIDMVSFTGSTEIGRRFLQYSGQSNMKRIVLECGGKNPCVVLDDADDLDIVAQHVVAAVFWNMGENCSANSRLIVDKKIKKPLLERIRHHMKLWPTGDPLNPVNRLGAIVSKTQYTRILDFIEKGKSEGGTLVCGGNAIDAGKGFFIEPTIFDNVTPDMTIARDEIFGPVLAIISVTGIDQAISIANDTKYGLTASVFTANTRRAHRMARMIRAGTISINCFSEGDITTPFGGYKQSGFGGRDNSIHAHEQYTELKTIWIDVSDSDISHSTDK